MSDSNITIDNTDSQQALSIKFSPALYVFLGSSPAEIGWRIKKFQDDAYGDLPIFQYVWVDTDTKETTDVAAWTKSGNVTVANMGHVRGAEILKRLDEYPAIKSWWPKNSKIRPGTFSRGANQVRIRGRFAFFASFNQNVGTRGTIRNALERAASRVIGIEQAQDVPRMSQNGLTYSVDNSQVRVVIVNSVCGGTGSGIVFDIAYILRNFFATNGIVAQFLGVQILPPVIKKALREMDQGQILKVQANGYSHLQDLDFLTEKQNWQVSYPGLNLDLQVPVFDYTYLIDIVNSQGKSLNDELDVYKMAAQALFMICITPIGDELASHQDNTSALSSQFKGKTAYASSFASASLVFPRERILDYCSARLAADGIRKVTNLQYDSSTKNSEHSALIQALGLEPEKLRKTLRQNEVVINNQLEFIQNAKNPGAALTDIRNEEANDVNERNEIFKKLRDRKADTTTLLLDKLHTKIIEYVAQFGPKYTADLLSSLLTDSTKSLASCNTDLDNTKTKRTSSAVALKKLEDAKNSLTKLSSEFGQQVTQWLLPKKWKDDLERDKSAAIDAMSKHNEALLNDELDELIKQIYTELIERIKDYKTILVNFTSILTEALGELEKDIPSYATSNTNADLFSLSREVVDTEYFDQFYAQHSATSQSNVLFSDLVNQTVDFSIPRLKDYNKKEIKTALIQLAANKFRDTLAQLNLLQEMNRHYGDKAKNVLERKIDEVLEYCSPFWRYGIGGEDHNPQRPSYLGIEDRNSPLLPDKYRQNTGKTMAVTSTGIRDTIFIAHVEHGVPLWMLTELKVWKAAYDKHFEMDDGSDPLNIIPDASRHILDPEDSASVGEMFAVALAFGYITQRKTFFYYDPEKKYQNPKIVPDQTHLIAQGREKAANAFGSNSTWTNEVRTKIVDEIGKIGANQAVAVISDYLVKLKAEKDRLPKKSETRVQFDVEIKSLSTVIEDLTRNPKLWS